MRRVRVLALLTAGMTVFAHGLSAQQDARCLVLGLGAWDGDTTSDHYTVLRVREPSLIRLSNTPPEWFPNDRSSFDARVLNRTGLRANLWTQTSDSIQLIATAALSDGWVLNGVMRADTLHARVRGTSDGLQPNVPRAAAYGLMVTCSDSLAIQERLKHVALWIASAPRDSAALARERAAEKAWWDELKRTGTIPGRLPPAAP